MSLPVDVEIGKSTSTECSVSCGIGNITTVKVICEGKKSEYQTNSGLNDVNFQIDGSKNCRTVTSNTPCIGTAADCIGLPIFYLLVQKLFL